MPEPFSAIPGTIYERQSSHESISISAIHDANERNDYQRGNGKSKSQRKAIDQFAGCSDQPSGICASFVQY